MLSSMSNISLTGLYDAQARMAAAAHNITAASIEGPVMINEVESYALPDNQGVGTLMGSRESVFGVDLVSEMLNLQLAKHSFEASARALKAADEVSGTLIDMFDTEDEQR